MLLQSQLCKEVEEEECGLCHDMFMKVGKNRVAFDFLHYARCLLKFVFEIQLNNTTSDIERHLNPPTAPSL